MADYEASIIDEGPGSSYLPDESTVATEAPRESQDKQRILIAIAVLALLLLLAGLLFAAKALTSSESQRGDDDDSPTREAKYRTTPRSPPTTLRRSTAKTRKTTTVRMTRTHKIATTTTTKRTTATRTPTAATTTTTRPPSTGYGFTVCTIGRSGIFPTMFPVREELCDFIVFTHVHIRNNTLASTSGNVAYETFIQVSTKYKLQTRTAFGLSHSPHMLSSELAQDRDGGDTARRFLLTAQKVFSQAGLSAVGVMGLVRTAAEFAQGMRLTRWFQEISLFADQFPNGTVFVGLKLRDKGKEMASNHQIAKDVFKTVKKMKAKLLVLVTHNVKDMGASSCVSEPVSSWSSSVYRNATKPALEHVLDFLVTALRDEQQVEVAVSTTLVFVAYQMKEPVTKPVKFGDRCVRNYRQSMEAYCILNPPNEEQHADSVTAVAFKGDSLFSFETPETVEKKIRRFVMALDDKVYRRVGWAFFDLAFEIHDESACPVRSGGSKRFSRVAVAKPILEENRKRKFNK